MFTTGGAGARALARGPAILLLGAVTVLAACSGGSDHPSPAPSPTPTVSPSAGGLGGTLHVVGSTDPAGLDPVAAASPQAAVLLRLTTRQLYTWTASQFPLTSGASASPKAGQTAGATPSPGSTGSPNSSASAAASTSSSPSASASASKSPAPTASPTAPVRPVPDLAARQPRITDGGRTYTIDLRGGAKWDVPGGRQVTAPDVVRGIKRLCNPADPSPLLPYFTGTIQGLGHFCAGFATIAKTPTAMASYLESTPLPGVHADNDMTVSFHLLAPTRDFLNLLTLPAASPVPTEMLRYAPDSAAYRSNLVSDGPYRITSYTPGKQILLRRNTQWSPGADPARTAYVDGVQVDFGVSPADQAARLASGGADLALDAVATTNPAAGTAGSTVVDRGTVASLFFNVSATTAGDAHGALMQQAVRQALQRCVDGTAVVRAFGGPALASASHQVLVPGTWGYQPQNLYSAGQPGGTNACRMGLALAGQEHLSLTYLAVGRGRDPAVVAAITEGFARAGISLRVVDGGSDEQVLTDGRTHWDIALLLTTPDWPSENARSYVVPRLTPLAPSNVGSYQSVAVQRGLASAAGATEDSLAARRWAALDTTIMRDPPYVPLARLRENLPRSTHIGGWSYLPTLDNADPTQIFLPVEAPAVSSTPASPRP